MIAIRLVIGLVVFLLASNASSVDTSSDFRSARWYDSAEQVRKTETAPFLEQRTEELNVAVRPPVPWKVEHLYYKETLLGHPVLILYRFDLDCHQLYEADYIFDHTLESDELLRLVAAIEDKYGVKLLTQYIGDRLFATGSLCDRTAVNINETGFLHFHTNRTTVAYHTANWSWLGGWAPGTEPHCPDKTRQGELLKEKL